MFNAHIGLPRIGFRNLDFVGTSILLENTAKTSVISQEFFRKKLRSAVNVGGKRGDPTAEAIEVFSGEWTADFVALSQPAFLGEAEKLLTSYRERRRAASRIRKLRAILHDRPLNLHLTITNPFIYLLSIFGEDADAVLGEAESASWAALIDELDLRQPDSQLYVWKWDEPAKVVEQFISELCGQTVRYATGATSIDPACLFEPYQVATKKLSAPNAKRLNYSADLYKSDLETIGRMDGVSLIGVN